MIMMSALHYINMLSWICSVLVHYKTSLRVDMLLHSDRVDMLLHSDILNWFWVNQSLILLLNAAYLEEKQQILIL